MKEPSERNWEKTVFGMIKKVKKNRNQNEKKKMTLKKKLNR